jgi:hypothetical protein
MIERHRQEIELVESKLGDLEVSPNWDWFVVANWPLPAGWNKTTTSLLILVPPGYPVTPPDNFYTDPDLRLAGGAQPGNTSASNQIGRDWLQFSFHVEGGHWHPHADVLSGHNLLTFLEGVRQRLSELS